MAQSEGGDPEKVMFLPDPEVMKLLDENAVDIAQALRDRGITGARITAVPSGDGTSREPLTAIIIASSVGIVALGAAIAEIVRTVSSRPRVVVTSEVVLVG